jgi:hypothetical protein
MNFKNSDVCCFNFDSMKLLYIIHDKNKCHVTQLYRILSTKLLRHSSSEKGLNFFFLQDLALNDE